ncbi:MAG: MutS family DNA mismatch repair protein [Planctomycetota bacterium]
MDDSDPDTASIPARDRYDRLLADSSARLKSLGAVDSRYGTVRLLLFLGGIFCLAMGPFAEIGATPYIIGGVFVAGFVVAAILNEPIRDAIDREESESAVLERLKARVERDWTKLKTREAVSRAKSIKLSERQKDLADDLDLLGDTSLFRLVSMAGTNCGSRAIANWLTGPAVAETAKDRAAAIDHLAPLRKQRREFYALATRVGRSSGDPDSFTNWATGDRWLPKYQWMVAWMNIAMVVSAVAITVLVISRVGMVGPTTARIALIVAGVVAGINILISTVMLGPAHQIFSVAMSGRRSVAEYQELFRAAEWLPESSNGMTKLQQTLLGEDRSATIGIAALSGVARLDSVRQSALTFLFYIPLQVFSLWDVRVLRRLEQWQLEYGNDVPEWFDALGELEALLSLAALRDENPDWVFPEWVTGDKHVVSTTQLGHPLLPDDVRVCNDVSIGPSGSVLLVTGSNMSGKSTMLRSMGLNISLAGAGAPVCATKFSLPSIELATSIRVRDNLAEGVSFYMAELQRLKGVVGHAGSLAEKPQVSCLYLLDEILQGTNSRERLIAVARVLERLLELGAIGAISTHDLELASEPELAAVSNVVHFREIIETDDAGKERMTFDYRMRQGVSPTTNALRLLEIVGICDGADP